MRMCNNWQTPTCLDECLARDPTQLGILNDFSSGMRSIELVFFSPLKRGRNFSAILDAKITSKACSFS